MSETIEILKESEMWERPEDKNVSAQRKYCFDHDAPMFLSYDGRCFSCGAYVFGPRGIPPAEAGKRLITGCPYCQRSFCD